MKKAYESERNIHEVFDKLQTYKNSVVKMSSKVKRLQEKEEKYKTVYTDLMHDKDVLKTTIHDLKSQLKNHFQTLEENQSLSKQVKELQKKIKEHELGKVRMTGHHLTEIHSLHDVSLLFYRNLMSAEISNYRKSKNKKKKFNL